MEHLPLPDEIILKILSYLSTFDLAKCVQVSKGLNKICEDKKFKQYHELKKLFKTSTLKLSPNDFIMLEITYQEAVKGITEALQQNGDKIKLVLEKEQERKLKNESHLFIVELHKVSSLKVLIKGGRPGCHLERPP